MFSKQGGGLVVSYCVMAVAMLLTLFWSIWAPCPAGASGATGQKCKMAGFVLCGWVGALGISSGFEYEERFGFDTYVNVSRILGEGVKVATLVRRGKEEI